MKSEQHETNAVLHSPKVWKTGTLVYTSAGLAMLFLWLLWGDFTWAMKDRAVGPSATLLIKQIGVSDFLYALIVIAFPNFTNIILGPVISYLSDRHRGPYGRRIPFLAFTTPFIVLGLYGLGLTPWLGGELHGLFPALSLHSGRLRFMGSARFRNNSGRGPVQRAGQRCCSPRAARKILRTLPDDQSGGRGAL